MSSIKISNDTTKAYVEEEPRADGWRYGINKYSDQPLRARWNDEKEEWEFEYLPGYEMDWEGTWHYTG